MLMTGCELLYILLHIRIGINMIICFTRECYVYLNESISFRKLYGIFRSEVILPLLLFLSAFFWVNISLANDVIIPMDVVEWEFIDTEFKCQLRYSASDAEYISFLAEPNRPMSLMVTMSDFSQAVLVQLSPPWQTPAQRREVASSIRNQTEMLEFQQGIESFIKAFSNGAWMRIESRHVGTALAMSNPANASSNYKQSSPREPSSDSLTIPSTRVDHAYTQFNQCRRTLPSMSYEQARDIELSFRVGQRVIDASQRAVLKSLSGYIQSDKTVQRVLIDGHTDNVGSSMGNLQLSRIRADDVASILLDLGIPDPLIEVRAHGDRYPISSNTTQIGQAKNRRVTVRVIRQSVDKSIHTLMSSQDEKTEVALK